MDVKTLQEQLETLRHFETLVANIVARIAELDRIAEHRRGADRQSPPAHHQRFCEAPSRGRHHPGRSQAPPFGRDEADLSLKRAELARDGLQESFKLAQETLLQAQIALQTDRTAAHQAELRAAIAAAETDLAALRRREAELTAALDAEVAAMCTLRDLLLADPKGMQSGGQPVPPELEGFIVMLSQAEHRHAEQPS